MMKTTFAAALASLCLASCSKNDEKPAPPTTPTAPVLTADFTLPAAAETQTALSFANLSQNATLYKWTFGDNTTPATDASPQHRFASRGTYPITLTAYRGTDSAVVTKNLVVKLYDQFAHAGIPTTSTYLTRGYRYEWISYGTPTNGVSTITALPDLPLTIVRVSPDTIRANGILGVPMPNSGNSFRMQGFGGSDASVLTIYIPGDSVELKEYSHTGHGYIKTDTHSGPRQR